MKRKLAMGHLPDMRPSAAALRLAVFVLSLGLAHGHADAQLVRAPLMGQSRAAVSATALRTVGDAAAGGGTIAAIHFDAEVLVGGQRVSSLGGGRSVALARFDARGRLVWMRRFAEEAGAGRPHLRIIERVIGLADGGAIIAGTFGDGGLDQGVLLRIAPDGRTTWEVHPTEHSDYSWFTAELTRMGTVVVLGSFFRGHFALPGSPSWSSRQRFTTFLAEVGIADGAVRWAERVNGEGRHIAVDANGGIYVAGTFRGRLRNGDSVLQGDRSDDTFVARFGPDGAAIDAVQVATPSDDTARGLAVLADGTYAVLTSSGPGALERYAITGFAPDGQRAFSEPLGRSAALVTARGAERFVVALAGPQRPVRVSGMAYDATDRVELLSVESDGARGQPRAIGFGGLAILVRSLRAGSGSGSVLLSGTLADPGQAGVGESFYVWLDPPARLAPTVQAVAGAVL
ncbi:MAG: hypothetical protein AB7S26_09665 [Sandaracinaceae bacterium]